MSFIRLFERYEGKQRGKWYRMKCPFHKENDASLDVDLYKSGFHCWGCGQTGNHVDLVMKLDRVSEATARNIISRYAGQAIRSGKLGAFRKRDEFKYLDASETLELFVPVNNGMYQEYLEERGLTVKLARKYDFREGSMIEWGWDDRLVYPIRDLYNNLCSIEGRTLVGAEPRYMKWRGSMSGLGIFGIDKIPEKNWGKKLIVVEGAIDALSIIKCGFPAVALACSEVTKRQLSQLRRVTEEPVVILDGVKKGTEKERRKALERITTLFSKKFLHYQAVEIPWADTDPNDLLRKGKLKSYLEKIL